MSSPAPPYTPAPLLIASSRLTTQELVTHFQDFSNNLRYVAAAPELVFERLVGNLSDSFNATSAARRQDSSTVQARQIENGNVGSDLEENSSALQASQVANAMLAAQLKETSSALRGIQLVVQNLNAKLAKESNAPQSSQSANKSLIVELQLVRNELRRINLANEILIADLAIMREKVPAPALVKGNPADEAITADGVCSCQQLLQRTFKTVTFANTYTTVNDLLVGLTTTNIAPSANIRVNAYPSEIQRDQFKINLDTWHGVELLYRASCAWIAIVPPDFQLQYGTFQTSKNHDYASREIQNISQITFKRAYTTPPAVVVWLNLLDSGLAVNWCTGCFATQITATGFKIQINTWSDTKSYWAKASWVAYSLDEPGITSGSFTTLDTRSPGLCQANGSGANESFGSGVFDHPPRVFVGLNAIHITAASHVRVTEGR